MVEDAVLGYLEKNEEISDSGKFAEEQGLSHDDIVNVIKSLNGFRLVDAEEIFNELSEEELIELLSKQNSAGETANVAAKCGYVELVGEMIKYYDIGAAGIKARNDFDALHIAAKQGDMDMVKVLIEAHPELSMTVDNANTTALHTATTQGHIEVVNYLLELESSLAAIGRSNGKTALHSVARNGHVQVVRALLSKEPAIATHNDKKGQATLHMAVKGQNLEVVEELTKADPSLINMVDTKGNTALHIATRKGRAQLKCNHCEETMEAEMQHCRSSRMNPYLVKHHNDLGNEVILPEDSRANYQGLCSSCSYLLWVKMILGYGEAYAPETTFSMACDEESYGKMMLLEVFGGTPCDYMSGGRWQVEKENGETIKGIDLASGFWAEESDESNETEASDGAENEESEEIEASHGADNDENEESEEYDSGSSSSRACVFRFSAFYKPWEA